MSNGCSCATPNTGVGNCDYKRLKELGIVLVRLEANDGTKNKIDLSVPFTNTLYRAAINNSDTSKRFYPIIDTDFNTVEVGEPTTVTGDYGTNYYVDGGLSSITYTFQVMNRSVSWVETLNKGLNCGNWGAYFIDRNGSPLGIKDGNNFYPVPLSSGISVMYKPAGTDDKPEHCEIKLTTSQFVDKTALKSLILDQATDAKMLSESGLIAAYATVTAPTDTGFSMSIYKATTTTSNSAVTGLVSSDFTLLTTGAIPVVITSVTETPAGSGNYVFVHANNTADKYVTVTKAGLDFESVNETLIDVP